MLDGLQLPEYVGAGWLYQQCVVATAKRYWFTVHNHTLAIYVRYTYFTFISIPAVTKLGLSKQDTGVLVLVLTIIHNGVDSPVSSSVKTRVFLFPA